MPSIVTVFLKLLPLYLSIFLGYVAGRFLSAEKDTVSKILFYLISPLVIFTSVMRTDLTPSILSLPLLVFILASTLSLIFYLIAKNFWNDTTVNLLAFTAGTGNTGYFGLPLAILFLNEQGEGIYILCLFGLNLYETTSGFYLCAKGSRSKEEVLRRLIRLPQIYAFLIGLLLNLCGIGIDPVFNDYLLNIKGSFSILGMMLIGLAISTMPSFINDKRFLCLSFGAKFVAWPLLIFLVIGLDSLYFQFYGPLERDSLVLISVVPLAVNTVVLSSLLNVQPAKAASAVLLSTLFALFYAPLFCYLFFG